MSLFGEKLQKIIENNEINVYRLTQQAGIERTMIHKIISNTRIPDAEYVRRLIAALPVSPFEQEELQTAYNISKDGELLYNQRGQVKRLIEKMYDLQKLYPAIETAAPRVEENADRPEIEVIRGELSLNRLVDDVLRREALEPNPYVFLTIPHEYTFFFDSLFLHSCKNPALKVECLFEFSKNADIAREKYNANLDIIDTLLPFIMHGGSNFTAYYVYSVYPAKYTATIPMPYFVGTSGCVVAIAADLQSAIVYRNAGVTNQYRQAFDNLKGKGQPLIGSLASMEDIAKWYAENADKDSTTLSGFGSHPCIAMYYDRVTLNALMLPDLPNRDVLLNVLETVYHGTNRMLRNGNNPSYFTLEGFDVFVREGRIETISEAFLRPYTPAARAGVIRKMIADTESGLMLYRVINTAKIRTPSKFYADVFSGSHINFAMGGPDSQKRISTVHICETGVTEAFHDFLLNAINTDMLYSKADTLREFYTALDKLEGKG